MSTTQDKILLTRGGFEALQKEYRQLINFRRPAVIERLSSSRQEGDLTENSEYIQAKEDLSFIDGRIREIEKLINTAMIIDENHQNCQKVKLGCRVTVTNGKSHYVFCLVGEQEADPSAKKISHTSPLGKALLGKKVGEKVEVEAPAGKILYRIVKIN